MDYFTFKFQNGFLKSMCSSGFGRVCRRSPVLESTVLLKCNGGHLPCPGPPSLGRSKDCFCMSYPGFLAGAPFHLF